MMLNLFYNYSIILCFFFSSTLISILLSSSTFALSKRVREYKKLVSYECGFNAFSSSRMMFDIHFFIVALLFLVFDVELIFLYPWSITMGYLDTLGMISVYLFLVLIIIGYCYEWRKGALNWVPKW